MSDLALIFADEACAEALTDARLLAAMARFEGALALASARVGIVPAAEAEVIARVCERATFDIAALARAARRAGALAIPFVRNLTAQVATAAPEAARYVHFGATSQDVTDTAVALCLRDALARVDAVGLRLGDGASAIVHAHLRTPTVARTLLQPALPIPFAFKAAVWLSLATRALAGVRAEAQAACVLQFGGAGGTLSAFGEHGEAVATELARHLGLPRAAITSHSARDGVARLGAASAIMAGAAGKIARDGTLLMPPEIGEAFEPV